MGIDLRAHLSLNIPFLSSGEDLLDSEIKLWSVNADGRHKGRNSLLLCILNLMD